VVRERWDTALRHSKIAVAAAEEAVAIADHDDDVVLLAQSLVTKSQVHEGLGDGRSALSAAREALEVYSRLDRELDDPKRVTQRLGDDSVLFPAGHSTLKDRFALLYAETADAQLQLARLIAGHEATTGAAEARRLAKVARATFQELAQFNDGYAARANLVAAGCQEVLDRLDGRSGVTSQPSSAEDLTRQAARIEETNSEQLRAQVKQAESHATKARADYAARRYAEAVENMRMAVETYRKVVPHSLWHKRELARALFDYAHHLEARGRRSAAVDAMDEAGLLFTQVHELNDRRFAAEVALCSRESRRLRLVRLRLRPRRTFVAPLA
jgi:tetratricopeptide (TPR) repeat protein